MNLVNLSQYAEVTNLLTNIMYNRLCYNDIGFLNVDVK